MTHYDLGLLKQSIKGWMLSLEDNRREMASHAVVPQELLDREALFEGKLKELREELMAEVFSTTNGMEY